MTVIETATDTVTDTSAHRPAQGGVAASTRRRRAGRPHMDGSMQLEVQTIKAYRLGDDNSRTVGYLRRIVNQRQIPDEARLTIEGDRITVEWAEG